ncbi:binding-protein-dependent transport systems inner membrane component [Alkaliphilus metalliredigens QYMF]|uniref:Binding-protein-dependent transport systems inner membrane component n=1 Tax=Alkaliphilus metalliredigens (strain QYMF) TaxID=293826 RepID=A6TPQ1_ALKMQ|nr:nickel transporter permease [Alkaliphilus metalliredigens]ABR48169.1 binding-protein-dependent transport systems inner membrane component [Alkaliphilus metalliredigens QYMF]
MLSYKRKYVHEKFYILLFFASAGVAVTLLSNYIVPHDPLVTNFSQILKPPSLEYFGGTDQLGRCVFSRVLSGAKNSLKLTFIMTMIVSVLGTIIGILSGYFEGVIDTVLMRISDMLLAFPGTIFAIVLVGMMGPSLVNTVIALALQKWTKYARMARSMVLTAKSQDYIVQAKLCGARTPKILFTYILPNIISPIVVLATMEIGHTMLSIAALSFLGLASQPPTPEWGSMLNEGKDYIQTAPWLMLVPGVATFLTVLVFNLLGDNMRDVLDPKE